MLKVTLLLSSNARISTQAALAPGQALWERPVSPLRQAKVKMQGPLSRRRVSISAESCWIQLTRALLVGKKLVLW